LELDNCK